MLVAAKGELDRYPSPPLCIMKRPFSENPHATPSSLATPDEEMHQIQVSINQIGVPMVVLAGSALHIDVYITHPVGVIEEGF